MDRRNLNDAGFTLLEVVVAMVIFGIVASSTAVVLVRAVGGSSDNRARAAAANIAAQTMDGLRRQARSAQGYTDLATQPAYPVQVQGRTYSVSTSVSVATKAGSGSPCTAGGLSDEVYKKVGVAVSWPASGPVRPVRSDTIVQNPGVPTDVTSGALGVIVSGPDGPQPLVPVNLSSGKWLLTDASGCAFFSGLTTGDYTATAAKTGYVGQTGSTTVSQTAGVQLASATVVNLAYAPASTPRLAFTTVLADGTPDSSYTWPGASTYTLKNDSVDRSGSTLTSSTAPVLYPFASGYDVWLGACPGEASSPLLNVATGPGTSPEVTVPVGGLTIANTGRAARSVTLRHTGTPACGTTYTTTVPPGAGVKLALPFGAWTAVAADGSVATPVQVALTGTAPTSAVTFP